MGDRLASREGLGALEMENIDCLCRESNQNSCFFTDSEHVAAPTELCRLSSSGDEERNLIKLKEVL
jgi:hypothetical protein